MARMLAAASSMMSSSCQKLGPGLWLVVFGLLAAASPAWSKPDSLKEVTDANWDRILAGEWMIEFYAPWCPACQQLQPVWKDFADWGDDMGVNVAKVDVTEQPGLSGRFIITSLPTIYHCKDGVFRKYQGPRTKEDFLSFVDDQKWKTVEPISSWFGPSSFLMNLMSALFKLSMFIRRCHNYMTDSLGIPVWGSYVIFGLVTLFLGLALGLLLVFIADFVFPSRRFSSDYHQKFRSIPTIPLQDEGQEADGEEDDEDDEDDEAWRRGRGSSEKFLQTSLGAAFPEEAEPFSSRCGLAIILRGGPAPQELARLFVQNEGGLNVFLMSALDLPVLPSCCEAVKAQMFPLQNHFLTHSRTVADLRELDSICRGAHLSLHLPLKVVLLNCFLSSVFMAASIHPHSALSRLRLSAFSK
uniref:Thioredoxin-related transmembrane protein 1 n=1 Tax=Oryzias latipes TaxID=8090 RepID=H2LYD8_ORYLA